MNKGDEPIYFDAPTNKKILICYGNVKEQLPFKYKCFAPKSFDLQSIENSKKQQ